MRSIILELDSSVGVLAYGVFTNFGNSRKSEKEKENKGSSLIPQPPMHLEAKNKKNLHLGTGCGRPGARAC